VSVDSRPPQISSTDRLFQISLSLSRHLRICTLEAALLSGRDKEGEREGGNQKKHEAEEGGV